MPLPLAQCRIHEQLLTESTARLSTRTSHDSVMTLEIHLTRVLQNRTVSLVFTVASLYKSHVNLKSDVHILQERFKSYFKCSFSQHSTLTCLYQTLELELH